jgi:hypothetical protein
VYAMKFQGWRTQIRDDQQGKMPFGQTVYQHFIVRSFLIYLITLQ